MKRSAYIAISVIIALAMVLTLVSSVIYSVAVSADYNSKMNEANDIKKEIDQKKNEVSKEKNAKQAIDNEISTLVTQINSLNSQISSLESEIAQSSANINKIENDIKESNELLKKRLRAMYEKGSMSYLDVLFSSSDISDFLIRMDVVEQITRHDNDFMDELAVKKAEIVEEKKKIEAKKGDIEGKKQQVAAQKGTLDKKSSESAAIIADMNKDISQLQAEYNAKKKEADAILAQAKKAAASNTTQYYGGGKLGWPSTSRGTITSEFGMRIFRGVPNNHTGIDIAVPMGTPVLAAEDGVVTGSGWRNSYGNCVTITHGTLSTLYAHNSALVVSVGQKVKKGDLIAYAGSTGNSTGPHIHFGVIDNNTGRYLNPRPYIF